MNFQPNDKVICVDDYPGPGMIAGCYSYPDGYIKKGQIYVVREIRDIAINANKKLNWIGLILVGVRALQKESLPREFDVGWYYMRFRKLSEVQEENRRNREIQKFLDQMAEI